MATALKTRRFQVMLVLASVTLAACIFVVVFEAREHARYDAWRRERGAEIARDGILMASPNERLVWENRPGAVTGPFAINRWGFRDVDHEARDKPEGTYRVAFVGDSVTYGYDTRFDEAFVSLIRERARRLNGRKPVQVMNFSVGGYNALQIAELVRAKVLAFSPDKVVYVLCLNDFDFDDASGQLIRYFRPPRSFFWERLTRPREPTGLSGYHSYHFTKHRDEVFGAIREIAELLAAKHVALQVAVVPVFDFELTSFRNNPLSGVHDSITRSLRDDNVPTVDLLRVFEGCSSRPPSGYGLDIWHPNRLGHRFVAEALFDEVLAEQLPDGPRPKDIVCDVLKALEPEAYERPRRAFEALLAAHSPARLAIDSSLLELEGFWPIEFSNDDAFAWSRDKNVIRIFHLHPNEAYRVRLELRDTGNRSSVSVGVEGGKLENAPVAPTIEVPSPLVANASGSLVVILRTETWRPSSRGGADTRDLGVALRAVEVSAMP